MYTELGLFIDGKWLNGEGRKGEDVINPATGKSLARLPHASKADLDAALAAAEKGFALWKATSAYDRSKIMRKAADLVRERYDHISKVQTQEQGKVYPESRAEVLTSADIIDWYAEEGRRTYGRIVPGRQKGVRQLVLQEPVGIVAAFTPWNFPTLTPVRKIAGALRRRLLDHHQGLGRNAGRLRRAGQMLRRRRSAGGRAQSGVRRAGGSVGAPDPAEVGQEDLLHRLDSGRQASRRSRRQGHEARHHGAGRAFAGGGVRRRRPGKGRRHHRRVQVSQRRPSLHLADALLRAGEVLQRSSSRASPNTPRASRSATGWRRASPWARSPIRAGSTPWRASSTTPRTAAARCVTGGSRHGNQGFFFQPTVVTDVPDDSKIMTEEPFGPVAPIVPFKTFDEVVERANSLAYGLAAYAFTTSERARARPSATPSSPAWSASTASRSRRRRRRSAASRSRATARKAASRACRPT